MRPLTVNLTNQLSEFCDGTARAITSEIVSHRICSDSVCTP
jgi:hypothetical protein